MDMSLGQLLFNAGPAAWAAGSRFKRERYGRAGGRYVGKKRRYNPRAYVPRRVRYRSGPELKFADTDFAPVNIPNTVAGSEADPPGFGAQTSPGLLSGVIQGDTATTRDGRQILVKSIHIRGAVSLQSFAGSTLQGDAIVRVALIQDMQTNGSQFSAEDVFLSTSNVEFSFRNLNFINRFKILKQRIFTLNLKAAAGDGAVNDTPVTKSTFNWFIRLNMQVNHTLGTGVVAAVTDNSLHLICFADSSFCDLKYSSRIRFTG